jgi:CHAD domain-containing protein
MIKRHKGKIRLMRISKPVLQDYKKSLPEKNQHIYSDLIAEMAYRRKQWHRSVKYAARNRASGIM